MGDQVERFEPWPDPIVAELMTLAPDGAWVRYSDYEKLETERDERVDAAEEESRSLLLALEEVEAERDQARKQVLEEVREAAKQPIHDLATHIGRARMEIEAVRQGLHPDQSKGAMVASKSGAELIAAERERQVSEEGWTPEHDDKHDDGELARAAAAYALVAGAGPTKQVGEAEALWPFQDGWKPSEDEIRDLAKAGALVAAEIDRLQHPDQSKGEQ